MSRKNPKYEFTREVKGKLKRIRALRDIDNPEYYVQAGDLGGWIQNERNLSHSGTCWVADEAEVRNRGAVRDDAIVANTAVVMEQAKVLKGAVINENATVSGRAIVRGYAQLYGSASVCDSAIVDNNACCFDRSLVSGDARVLHSAVIEGRAVVKGTAVISGFAHIYGKSVIHAGTWSTTPLQVQGSQHFVNFITPDLLSIGCMACTVEEWLKQCETTGKRAGYSPDEIKEYRAIIRLMKEWMKIYQKGQP